MAKRLKTEEEIEADMLKMAAMIRAEGRAQGDQMVAEASLTDIVRELRIVMLRRGIGMSPVRH